MKKSRFSEAQMVGILKEVELGAKVAETWRKHGISEPTYYKWKSQFSGMTVSHLSQLRQLQDENTNTVVSRYDTPYQQKILDVNERVWTLEKKPCKSRTCGAFEGVFWTLLDVFKLITGGEGGIRTRGGD
ncbi:MAG: transposase [Hydrogenophaga sp.]|uniref:transposase n=1 Tax=Hydrogenophaga sp. TaxID=1904254 RepID=UPI00262E1BAD|nr:transposase [Hydrogenophaga sp.]MCW5668458.1 transposase [Hydrogenophaga sp.]